MTDRPMMPDRGVGDYSIETPEQVALYFPLAGLGSRFLALVVDIAIQTATYFVLFIVIAIVISVPTTRRHMDAMSDTAGKWFVAGIILIFFLLYWGYFSLFEALKNGQTPGKRVMKIRVIKESGRQITFFEALARNLLRVIDMLPGMYLIGAVSIMITRQNKRLGDLVADTIVVHERQDEFMGYAAVPRSRSFTSGFYETPAAPQLPLPAEMAADRVARLTPDDLQLIDSYLARALALPMATRATLASRLLDGLCAKMGVPVPMQESPERTLEVLAFALRGQRPF